MNLKTLAKIEAATPFLLRFRNDVPEPMQQLIAPYLDQPYQLALKILDCCLDGSPISLDEISTRTGIHKVTVRQVIGVFQEGGIEFQTQPKQWQMLVNSEKRRPEKHKAEKHGSEKHGPEKHGPEKRGAERQISEKQISERQMVSSLPGQVPGKLGYERTR